MNLHIDFADMNAKRCQDCVHDVIDWLGHRNKCLAYCRRDGGRKSDTQSQDLNIETKVVKK